MQEALSGPMFQRPGTQLFTAAEIQPQVDRLYPHLNQQRRRDITTRLVAPDRRPASVAASQGTYRQQGQRFVPLCARIRFAFQSRAPWPKPTGSSATRAASVRLHCALTAAPTCRRRNPVHIRGGWCHLTAARAPSAGYKDFHWQSRPGSTMQCSYKGEARLNNPHRYAWRVDRAHATSGITTQTTIAERVVAYLHHGSLNPAAHQYFTAPLNDPRFYATSRFAPPAAPPAGAGGAGNP